MFKNYSLAIVIDINKQEHKLSVGEKMNAKILVSLSLCCLLEQTMTLCVLFLLERLLNLFDKNSQQDEIGVVYMNNMKRLLFFASSSNFCEK